MEREGIAEIIVRICDRWYNKRGQVIQLIKDWYLAEGGHEGPCKLWGEKAPNDTWAQTFYKNTAQQILQFLDRKHNLAHKELQESAIQRSRGILESIKKQYKGKLELQS